MATLVDELVVTLGLDTSKFTAEQRDLVTKLRGVRQETDKTQETLNKAGQQLGATFTSVKNELLTLLGVSIGIGGTAAGILRVTNSVAGLGDAARAAGVDAHQLGVFAQTMERLGAPSGAAENAFKRIASLQALARIGQGGKELFSASPILQVNPFASAEDMILGLSAAFQRAKGNPNQTQQVREAGTSLLGADVVAAIQRATPQELAKIIAEARVTSPTDEQVKHLTDLQESFKKFEQSVGSLFTQWVSDLAPKLIGFLETLTHYFIKAKEELPKLEKGYDTLTDPNSYHFSWTGGENKPGNLLQHWWDSYFGPSGGNGASTGGVRAITPPIGPTQAHANMLEARDYFKSKGLTDAQVAGILAGGPAGESGFDPNIVGAGGDYGFFQYTGSRKAELFRRYGPNPTLRQQLDFAWSEMSAGAYQDVLAGIRAHPNDPAAVAGIVADRFENPYSNDPAKHAAEVQRRASGAYRFNVPTPGPKFGPPLTLEQTNGLPRGQYPAPALGPRASNTSVNVGDVHVHNPLDAKDVANRVSREIAYSLASQADRGMTA